MAPNLFSDSPSLLCPVFSSSFPGSPPRTAAMALVALQSKDHREILDIVDRLRSKGVGRYVDLPEIIVCGDQSAGKSSVLEAISGMSFPTKDNLCTRFATELVLRRDPDFSVRVSINPGPERSAAEKEQLARFQLEMGAQAPDLGQVVDKAKEAMGLSDSKQFSTDTLRVELSGPSQPHLTMVDLPGLFRAGNSEQSMDDAKTVHDMVHGYMKRPRSIILAVVSAKSDFALQDVTELARELDPSGSRTIGLITKPDTLDVGSDSERSYVKLAQNQDVVFRLGWHVLKNRNYEMRDAPSAERDDAEEKFFATGIWTSLSPTHLGIRALVPRLSNVLKDQILDQLPGLLADTEAGISDCRSQLDRLGTSRATTDEQRRYLLQVSQEFSSFMKDAVDGVYNDPFFGSARTDDGYEKRLRAVVQNSLIDFREDMKVDGETRLIVEPESSSSYPSFRAISRAKYVQQVKALMDRNRGCELSGTFNPLIVGELFTEQCQPWSGITQAAKETIVDAVYRTTRAILKHCTVEETTDSLFRIIHGSIDNLKRNVNNKVDELLRPHYEGHPITYNHYLTDNVQKAQAGRRRKQMEEVILKQLKLPEIKSFHAANFSPLTLLNALEERTEVDMELHAGELAVDYMQAYYKVSTIHSASGVSPSLEP